MSFSLKGICMIRKSLFKYLSQLVLKLVFLENYCKFCLRSMAAVPQGAFAAKKIRRNEERRKEFSDNMELNPTNYSSKFMNSIWGQYNRYSVHNLKKIMDKNVFAMSVPKENRGSSDAQAADRDRGTLSTDHLGSVGSAISFSPKKMYN